MKNRISNQKKTSKRNFNFHLLITGFLVILLFGFASLFGKMQERFELSYTNISISCADYSIQKINPSLHIKIDGEVVFQVDCLSTYKNHNNEIHLKKGKHIIETSTLENRFYSKDTIEVVDYPNAYFLNVNFNHRPHLNEYKSALIDYLFFRTLEGKDYSEIQKRKIREQITHKINTDSALNEHYTPSLPHFTVKLTDLSDYEID